MFLVATQYKKNFIAPQLLTGILTALEWILVKPKYLAEIIEGLKLSSLISWYPL